MDYRELKKILEQDFKQAEIDELADIDWIIAEVTSKQRSMLPFINNFTDEELSKIMQLAKLRLEHIPLDYILGKSNFMGREFKVNKNVLIPRLDTEILIETILKNLKNKDSNLSILDIGTGSGILAITIALETGAKVTAVDISKAAIEVAKENAISLKADVKFLQSDLFEKLDNQSFDLIVSNPPYIETVVIETLEKEVKGHEPRLALDGGSDGLQFYKKIIEDAPKYLNSGGRIFFEIGYNQANAVSNLLAKYFTDIIVVKDYDDNDRVVFAKLK